jgi:hypothetical protein
MLAAVILGTLEPGAMTRQENCHGSGDANPVHVSLVALISMVMTEMRFSMLIIFTTRSATSSTNSARYQVVGWGARFCTTRNLLTLLVMVH